MSGRCLLSCQNPWKRERCAMLLMYPYGLLPRLQNSSSTSVCLVPRWMVPVVRQEGPSRVKRDRGNRGHDNRESRHMGWKRPWKYLSVQRNKMSCVRADEQMKSAIFLMLFLSILPFRSPGHGLSAPPIHGEWHLSCLPLDFKLRRRMKRSRRSCDT